MIVNVNNTTFFLLNVIMIFLYNFCMAQNADIKGNQINNLSDTLKMELSLFSLNGNSGKITNLFTPHLDEIVLKRCSNDFAYFEKSNIYDNIVTVEISAIQKNSIMSIDTIYVWYGRYNVVYLPDIAFQNISNPKFCEKYTKKNKPIASKCKVFRSRDRKRLYIYMLNDEGKNRYEVIWIMKDRKYYGKIINSCPE